jgi:BlaR1 peptidase M56
MGPWALAGTGVVLAWCGLPLIARAAWPRSSGEAASAHARLVLALVLSAALFVAPSLHAWLPRTLTVHPPIQVAFHLFASPEPWALTPPTAPPVFAVSPFGLVFFSWMVVFGIAVGRAVRSALRLRRLVANARAAPSDLVGVMREEARVLGITPPRLRVSDEAGAPFVAGLLAPVVVLPEVLVSALDDGDIALVLRHELLHLRRGDLRVATLVAACATLFAGHPTIRRLVHEIQLAREAAVDAEVAGAEPHAYATLLVEVASLATYGEKLAHVSMDDTALARRIAMLTQRKRNEPRVRSRAVVLAAATAAGFGLVAPSVLANPPHFDEISIAVPRVLTGPQETLLVAPPGDGPPPHFEQIKACFEASRREDPNLVVDTVAEFTLDKEGKVLSASVPTPAAPSFQRCVEDQAKGWTLFPVPRLPADASKPAPDAPLHISLWLHFPEK